MATASRPPRAASAAVAAASTAAAAATAATTAALSATKRRVHAIKSAPLELLLLKLKLRRFYIMHGLAFVV